MTNDFRRDPGNSGVLMRIRGFIHHRYGSDIKSLGTSCGSGRSENLDGAFANGLVRTRRAASVARQAIEDQARGFAQHPYRQRAAAVRGLALQYFADVQLVRAQISGDVRYVLDVALQFLRVLGEIRGEIDLPRKMRF